MEQPREQPGPTGSVVYQQPYYAPAPARVSGWTKFRRFVRLILRRLIYGLMLLLRPLRRYAGFVVIIVALLGVMGWMALQLWGPKPDAPTFQRAESLPPLPAAESYLDGRKTFNADMMWDAFSSDYQATQLRNGGSKATLQSLISQERRYGFQYQQAQYIGGVKLDNGGSMYFYSVDLSVQSQKLRLPVVFMADPEGKIEGVMTPLDRLLER